MFYIMHDEYIIISTEDLNMAAEYLETGMQLYGFTDNENFKDLLMHECSKVTA